MAEGGVLPPAIQEFVANAEQWIAGIDEMIAADDKLLESIAKVKAAAEDAGITAAGAGDAEAAGAEAGAGAESAEAADAAAESERAQATAQADVGDTAREAAAGVGDLAKTTQASADAALEAAAREDDLAVSLAGLKTQIAEAAEAEGVYVDAAGAIRDANGLIITSAGTAADALRAQANAATMSADELRVLQAQAELNDEAEAQLAASAGLVTDALGVQARASALAADSDKALKDSDEEAGAAAEGASGKFKLLGLGLLAGAAISVKMAADFQQNMTKLVTSAGEPEKAMGEISRGILAMSVATNTSATNLAQGMYYVSSAGYTGARGLTVLKAAAEGAQAEQASLVTVSDALTTAMVDYHEPTSQATAQMDQMIAAVSRGKMSLQDFAGSLSNVLPVAAKAGLGFAQVAGAIATMTAQGMSSRQATQDLRHVIMSLQNPTAVQTKEMGQLGLSSINVAKNLGKRGLTGTLDLLTNTILHNMGRSGLVLLKAFNQSKMAAQSAKEEIDAMPPSIAKLARSYADGSITAKQWNAIMFQGSIPAKFKNLLQQFASTENEAKGFNDQLKAGGTDAQTFSAAMSKATGGITGTQVALMLGGKNAAIFNNNVKAISASSRNAGSNISTWGDIQKNFNFQLGSAEKAIQAMAISFGQTLLPPATKALHLLAQFAGFLAKNAAASKALAVIIGGILAVAFERSLAKGIGAAGKSLGRFKDDLGNVIGFFRKGDAEASGFSKMLTGIGNAGKGAWNLLKSAWSGLTGLFQSSTESAEAAAAAQDEQAVSADVLAASTDAAAVSEDVLSASTDVMAASEDVAAASAVALDVALSPIIAIVALIVLAVAGLVIGFILLWDHCKAFRDFWKDAWRIIEEAAEAAWHYLDGVFHQIMAVTAEVVDWIKAHWKLLAFIFGALMGPVALLAAFIITHWRLIEEITEAVWRAIGGYVRDALAIIKDIVTTYIDITVAIIRDAWDLVSSVTRDYWDIFVDIVKTDITATKDVILDVLDLIIGIWRTTWDTARQLIAEAWALIKVLVSGAMQFILAIVEGHWGQLLSITESTWSRVVGIVRDMGGTVVSAVLNIGREIVSAVLGIAGSMFSAGAHIIESLASGIASAAGSVVHAIGGVVGSVLDHIPLSPAKTGPLSGRGDPLLGGQRIITRLAEGMLDEKGAPAKALAQALAGVTVGAGGKLTLAGSAFLPAGTGTAAAGGGGTANMTVKVDLANTMSTAAFQHGLQSVIQTAVLDYAIRNPNSGLTLPAKSGIR